MCKARFSILSLPQLSLWRTVLPEEAGMGLTPARDAKAAWEWTLPWWDQTVRQIAAATGPTPGCSSRAPRADVDQLGELAVVSFEVLGEFCNAAC